MQELRGIARLCGNDSPPAQPRPVGLRAAYAHCVPITIALKRLGYRAAYAGLRGYWFLIRPQTSGVKCVLTNGDRVLLVRHSYGPRAWDLPGGSVRSGEDPEHTARREMQEELGLDVERWHSIGQLEVDIDHRHDRIHCFQAELPSPEVTIDEAELTAARWFDPGQLPGVGVHTRQILALADGVR
jgi:8-oxo-dGTP pyrophosphatase MutT (NUDIX family)